MDLQTANYRLPVKRVSEVKGVSTGLWKNNNQNGVERNRYQSYSTTNLKSMIKSVQRTAKQKSSSSMSKKSKNVENESDDEDDGDENGPG